jgi:hypothetical protein
MLMFFTEIFHLLVEQNNVYYQQHLDRHARSSHRLPDITLADMITFAAWALQMGHTLKDTLHNHNNMPAKSSIQLCCHLCCSRSPRKGRAYKCIRCDVGLCVVSCFEEYHTEVNFLRTPTVNTVCCDKAVIQGATDLLQQPELCEFAYVGKETKLIIKLFTQTRIKIAFKTYNWISKTQKPKPTPPQQTFTLKCLWHVHFSFLSRL